MWQNDQVYCKFMLYTESNVQYFHIYISYSTVYVGMCTVNLGALCLCVCDGVYVGYTLQVGYTFNQGNWTVAQILGHEFVNMLFEPSQLTTPNI